MNLTPTQSRWVAKFVMVVLLAAIAATFFTGYLTSIVLRNGSHAIYCPAGTSFFVFPCTPTAEATFIAVRMFLYSTAILTAIGAGWINIGGTICPVDFLGLFRDRG